MLRLYAATDPAYRRFANQLGALGEQAARTAMVRAVNRVTDMVMTRTVRSLVLQTSAPRALVVRALRKRKASIKGGEIEGIIEARGTELSLKHFGPRQIKAGTKAKVWGKSQLFPGTFMGPKPGVLNPNFHGRVLVRSTKARYPIEAVYGPSIPKEMVKDQTAEAFQDVAGTHLPLRLAHEIGRLLPGA